MKFPHLKIHKRILSLIQFSLLLVFLFQFSQGVAQVDSHGLLSPTELNKLMSSDKSLVIIDLRKENQYDDAHLPGAVNTQRKLFENKTLDYGGMIAPQKQVEKLLSSLGIKQDSHLVIYDESGGLDVVRFWFVIKTFGHPSVRLLDGGYANWKSHGLTVSSNEVTLSPSSYSFFKTQESEYYATIDYVKRSEYNPNTLFLDVRSDGEYSSGHIPGAINLNWTNNLDDEKNFKSKEDLLQQFTKIGITPDKEIITYCRSGVRASHTAFVLRELLGFKNVKIFDGSWIEWSHFDEKVEK